MNLGYETKVKVTTLGTYSSRKISRLVRSRRREKFWGKEEAEKINNLG
jgi:hypothetical protein